MEVPTSLRLLLGLGRRVIVDANQGFLFAAYSYSVLLQVSTDSEVIKRVGGGSLGKDFNGEVLSSVSLQDSRRRIQ